MEGIADALKSIDTFAELQDGDLDALSGICSPAQYEPGTVIAREGYEAESLFALLNGSVGIWIDHGSASSDLLAVRKAPCLVGEMSVADELPRSATIVAGSPVSGFTIDAAAFKDLLERRGRIALSLMKGISRLVRTSNDSFVSELRERNAELIRTNAELRDAQRRLVRQERLSSLGKFSSMIIHDLRNPLSVIKGYADLLELKLDGGAPELVKYASNIRRETARLTGLTNEWLDFSRGELRLAYSAVSMTDMFAQLRENCESGLASKGIAVEWSVGFGDSSLMDAERMLRALINLVDNARKACGKNGHISVSADREGDRLVISVKDDGVGMDEETLSHVFDPFYSASDRGGTGLGMHIVKTVVEAHGGVVDVGSVVGEGTEISISLPLRN